ncbi:MAG TPA: response regulator [Acidimicrobiales bacterium]|nr:response regulator [Acidimicrobiales bacterium]
MVSNPTVPYPLVSGPDGPAPANLDAVRVLVVDDSPDIRVMLKLLLGRDERFTLVGEAANGLEAVEMAGLSYPDLVILDRQMPVMGGLEAIPLIREASPHSDIVLYTAAAEEESEKAAIAAGAVGLLEKQTMALGLVENLARMLVDHWDSPDSEVEVRVGPVPSSCARLWVANSLAILAALRAKPEVIGEPVSPDLLDYFEGLLRSWDSVAQHTDVFVWVGRADPEAVKRVVEEWARVDSMGDEKMAELGCAWSGPEARPFFIALSDAVIDALTRHESTRRLAERLAQGAWPAVAERSRPCPSGPSGTRPGRDGSPQKKA